MVDGAKNRTAHFFSANIVQTLYRGAFCNISQERTSGRDGIASSIKVSGKGGVGQIPGSTGHIQIFAEGKISSLIGITVHAQQELTHLRFVGNHIWTGLGTAAALKTGSCGSIPSCGNLTGQQQTSRCNDDRQSQCNDGGQIKESGQKSFHIHVLTPHLSKTNHLYIEFDLQYNPEFAKYFPSLRATRRGIFGFLHRVRQGCCRLYQIHIAANAQE